MGASLTLAAGEVRGLVAGSVERIIEQLWPSDAKVAGVSEPRPDAKRARRAWSVVFTPRPREIRHRIRTTTDRRHFYPESAIPIGVRSTGVARTFFHRRCYGGLHAVTG